MPSLARRLLVPVGLTALFLSGCAHPGTTTSRAAPDTSDTKSPRPVTAEEIRRDPTQPIEQGLAGRFPGVEVDRTPDGGVSVRIRGGSSIMGSNEPLYVIDGIEITPGPNGALTGINPYDIETIEVLKDATSTAMYGSRGSNGVIIIKMKKPPSH